MWQMIGFALAAAGGVQANHRPARVTIADLDKLVAVYRELDLPLPPANEPLVAFNSRGYVERGVQHNFFGCAYLIAKDGKPTPGFFQGLELDEKSTGDKAWLQPNPKVARSFDFMQGQRQAFPENDLLAIAMIEGIRGHHDFALAFLKRASESPVVYGPSILRYLGETASLETKLGHLALEHWFNELADPQSDRGYVLQHLTSLVDRFPELCNENVAEAIFDLDATVHDRYHGSDPIESLIDALCDCEVDGKRLESPDPSSAHYYKPLLDLVACGYEAIPHLIAHAQDKRLIRFISPGFRMSSARLVTVGEVCMDLAEQFSTIRSGDWQLASRADAVQRWWSTASKLSERENCLARLMAGEGFLPEAPMRWAEGRFPDVLLEVYDDILKKGRSTQTYPLLEAMERSKLDRSVVIDAAERGTLDTDLTHVHSALWILQRLDHAKFDSALVSVLQRLPAACSGPPWLCREATFGQLVGYSNSREAWGALADATQRADVDLRLELIRSSTGSQLLNHDNTGFLRYVLKFFDDPSVASHKLVGPFIGEEPHYGLPTQRVQDLATAVAADALGMKGVPPGHAFRKTWNAFRSRVKAKALQALQSQTPVSSSR